MRILLTLSFFVLHTALGFAQNVDAIRVHRTGDAAGATTIYLPGFATPGEALEELATAVDPARNNLFVSYAGFGGVPAVDTAWYPQVREAVFAYVDDLPDQRFALVGHSMGGNLAVELAARFPERVTAVVLLDALPCMRCVMMPGVPAEAMTYNNPQTQGMLALPADQVAAVNAQMAAAMTTDTARQRQLAAWMNAADRKTSVYGYTDLLRLDLRDQVADVTAPITVLASPSFGRETAETNMRAQYAKAPALTLEVAPDGTLHYLMWDAPVWTATQVRKALAHQAEPRG